MPPTRRSTRVGAVLEASRARRAPLALLLGALVACGGEGASGDVDGGIETDGAFDAASDASLDLGDASADAHVDERDADVPSDAEAMDAAALDGAVPDAEVTPGEAAMPCDASRPCAEGLRCVTLAASQRVGYCAPTCTTLHSTCGFFGASVHAECSIELPDGTLACGFICVLDHGDHSHDYTCPSGDWGRLRCERVARDHGHRYCAPNQE